MSVAVSRILFWVARRGLGSCRVPGLFCFGSCRLVSHFQDATFLHGIPGVSAPPIRVGDAVGRGAAPEDWLLTRWVQPHPLLATFFGRARRGVFACWRYCLPRSRSVFMVYACHRLRFRSRFRAEIEKLVVRAVDSPPAHAISSLCVSCGHADTSVSSGIGVFMCNFSCVEEGSSCAARLDCENVVI